MTYPDYTEKRINCTHYLEGRQARRNLHLHIDGAGINALECNRRDPLDHGAYPHLLPASVAQVVDADKNICRTN